MNNIELAAVFNRILDEKMVPDMRTMWMENTTPGMVYDGGAEIKVPILGMDGLGTMVGYRAPMGSVTLGWETKRLQWYRGRDFEIGRYEVDETNMALTVGNALRVFLREQVIPEVDCLRISTMAQAALGYGAGSITQQETSGITADNILDMLMADIAKVQDKIGETEQLYIQISTGLKAMLQMSSKIQRYLSVRDYTIRSASLRIDALNDQYLIGTPSAYMRSVAALNDGVTDGQTVGGVSFTNFGPAVNWIISARPAVDAIAKPQVTKVIDPDTNQTADAWKIMFAIRHGAWAFDNKAAALHVNMDTTLSLLSVTSVAGTVATGDSIITTNAPVPYGMRLVWKAANGTAPAVVFGTALTAAGGWADLPASGLINATNGHKITVAMVAKSGLPVASGNTTIVAKT